MESVEWTETMMFNGDSEFVEVPKVHVLLKAVLWYTLLDIKAYSVTPLPSELNRSRSTLAALALRTAYVVHSSNLAARSSTSSTRSLAIATTSAASKAPAHLPACLAVLLAERRVLSRSHWIQGEECGEVEAEEDVGAGEGRADLCAHGWAKTAIRE